jgi:hypothetical protein
MSEGQIDWNLKSIAFLIILYGLLLVELCLGWTKPDFQQACNSRATPSHERGKTTKQQRPSILCATISPV